MYIVKNTSTTRKGIPCAGVIEPGSHAFITDDDYTKISTLPAIVSWVADGALEFTQSMADSALEPADTSGPQRFITPEEMADPDVDTTDNPNTPEKLALLEQLAGYGIIETTRSSESKLNALLAAAQAEE